MSHETHRLSVRGSMDTPMRERRIKWGRGEVETLSIHVVSTQCALGLTILLPPQHKAFTAIHKHYSVEQWVQFGSANPEVLDYVAVSAGTSDQDWAKLQEVIAALPKVTTDHFCRKRETK